jgi:hypothetical protein
VATTGSCPQTVKSPLLRQIRFKVCVRIYCLWAMVSCGHVGGYGRFGGTFRHHLQGRRYIFLERWWRPACSSSPDKAQKTAIRITTADILILFSNLYVCLLVLSGSESVADVSDAVVTAPPPDGDTGQCLYPCFVWCKNIDDVWKQCPGEIGGI